MAGVVLVVVMLALMASGFFVMSGLDGFLFRNQIAIEPEGSRQAPPLRIAFSNPAVVGAVTVPLEQLCKLHANMKICLYVGDTHTILKQLAADEIDMAFLAAPAVEAAADPWAQLCVALPQGPLLGGNHSLPILPLEEGRAMQWLTWRNAACDGRAEDFVRLLEKDLRLPSGTAGEKMI